MNITGQAAAFPGSKMLDVPVVPHDPVAVAMFTAHRVDDSRRSLAHATERMAAARKAKPAVAAIHVAHVRNHLTQAINNGHQLVDSVNANYPAEAAELKALNQIIGMARAAYPQAGINSFAHLVETILYHEAHGKRHADALATAPAGAGWDFDADHVDRHLKGALEHVGKLEDLIRDNYPAEARWLAGLNKIEAAGSITGQAVDLSMWEGWRKERRGPGGEWTRAADAGQLHGKMVHGLDHEGEQVTGLYAHPGRVYPRHGGAVPVTHVRLAGQAAVADGPHGKGPAIPGVLASVTGQAGLELASFHDHHIPGTPFNWRHGWIPLTQQAAMSHFRGRIPPTWHPDGSIRDAGPVKPTGPRIRAAGLTVHRFGTVTYKAKGGAPVTVGSLSKGPSGWVALHGDGTSSRHATRKAAIAEMVRRYNRGWQTPPPGPVKPEPSKPEPKGEPAPPAAPKTPRPRTMSAAVTQLAQKGGQAAASLVGAGAQAWNGQVRVYKQSTDPSAAAWLDWDGKIGISDVQAKGLLDEAKNTNPDAPVDNPNAFLTMLHELIHGSIGKNEKYRLHQRAYQKAKNASIEEGFTELGSAQHAAEWFKQVGVGDRPTKLLARDARGSAMDNPRWEARSKQIQDQMKQAAKRLRSAGPQYNQAYNAVQTAITDLQTEQFPSMAIRDLAGWSHTGDPKEQREWAKTVDALKELAKIPSARHQTMSELAADRADPHQILARQAWHHYGWQTAAAQTWIEKAARAEGVMGFSTPGTPGYKRSVQIADEINRQGPGQKLSAMAKQVIRAAGGNPEDFYGTGILDVERAISDNWPSEFSPGEAELAAAKAWEAATKVAKGRVARAKRHAA